MIRKVLTVFFFALLMSHLFMVTSSAEEIVASIVKEEETLYPEIEADNDELFAAYVDQLFNPRFRFPRPVSGTNNQIVYNYLKAEIDEIAAGTRESTIITIPLSAFGLSTEEGFTASELGVAAIVEGNAITNAAKNAMYDKIAFEFGKVMNYLFAVCPYELYWCDKTIGYGCTYADDLRIGASYDSEVGWKLYFKQADANAYKVTFRVSADYMKEGSEDNTTADTAKTGAASNALKNAQKVLSDNDAKTDLKKLESYRDYIRSQVKYNYTAANDDSTPYGNPWQMIWVFDGDPDTNVVCEGYSKAFQYLCDKSRFNNTTIDCDTVTGIMTGGTGSGGHMWNLITIDGLHYLTDITNTFTGKDGIWSLFLDGATSGDLTNGYMVAGLRYEYDAKTKETYDDDALKISRYSYYVERQSGVAAVSALIGEIGEVEYTKACKARIDEAREAYDALADDQKQNVGNYNVLTEAEARYAALEAAAATVDYRRASADDNGNVTYSSDTAYPCISVTDSTTEWTDGSWYVVNGNETVSNRIIVTGTVNLILRDGAVLRAKKGITAAGTSTLNIFGQEAGTGKLIADTVGKVAAIGGDEGTVSGGDIVIHGGVIEASSGNNGTAAIGGAYLGDGCNLTILGGSITAASAGSGAGIGGGQSAAGGNIVIYDGSVEASSYAGAGIGGGIYGNGGNLIIYGGNVTGTSSTGVGFGGDLSGGSGSVAIRGGEVTAIGDTRAIHADTITNDMTGTGWTDIAGSTGRTRIAINANTNDIKGFKKIQFPAVVVPVSGISLNKSETTLVVGGTETLEASIDPADADQTVTWVSSNSDSVTVMDGTITAVKAGEASITATATNGTMDTTDDKTATCVVTVKKAKLSNLAVSIDNWTYGSTASTPVVTGNTGNGAVTFEYKVNGADDSTYTTDVPVNAGNYTIRASVAESEQYEKGVAAVDFTISMAAGTISYVETAVSKTYGDNAFTNMLTNNGDGTVTYASDHAEVAAVDAQTGEVTIAGVGDSVITATVADGTNYSYETKTASFTIHVSAATLTITPEAGQTKVYGAADPAFIYSVSGLVNGDKESVVTGALARTEGNNVGAYEYAIGTLAAENYTITLGGDARFTITPRSLTDAIVTLDHDSLVYNETEQTVSVTGVVYEDEPEKAVPSDAYTVSGNKGTNKGTYTVVITAVAGSNYKDSVQKIWKITDKPMNVSALDVPVVYDGQPHSISVRVTDPSEGAQILYGESEDSCSSETKPTITNVSESPKTIWYKVSAENYEDYYGFATVTINPKSITSISGLKAVDKVYDGTVAGTIDDSSATYAGKISGDTLSVTGDAAFNDASAGENKSVTFTNLSLKGDSAGNYTLASAAATGTGKITKAVPTVTAPIAISGLVYTGSLQTLAEAGATTGGELQYAVSMDAAAPEDGWSTVIPSAANTGTYYVWYKVVGGTNYRDVAPAHVTANINPADKSALNNTITEAETYYNSIKNDYAEVADILYNTIENAKQIGNQSNVTAADVSAAIEAINTAKAAAEAEVSTAEAVAAAISSVNAVDPSKYIQSDQQKVAEAKNTAIAAINAALTQEAVNEALAAFNHTIGNCKTEAEKREEESKQEEKQEEKKEEKQEETQKETLEEKKDPIPAPDPVLGTRKTLEAKAKSISENGDPKGSTFSLLQMTAKKTTKTSIRIGWKAVPKAAGYVVYGAPCGSKYVKLSDVKGTGFTHNKLKKGKYYKYFVAAYDKNGNILAASRTIHVATSGGKKGNPKSVKLNKKKVTLKQGKTFNLKATQKKGKLKAAKHRKVAYETDNNKVATVSSSGKIKAVGAGTCNIYAYTQDGKFAKCKVTVKK